MAQAHAIISSVLYHVTTSDMPDFAAWNIGLTKDLPEAYAAWGSPGRLVYWEAASSSEALVIESFFVNEKRMQRVTNGELDHDAAIRVCIYPVR